MKLFTLLICAAMLLSGSAPAQQVINLQQCIKMAQDSQYVIRYLRLEEAKYAAAERAAGRAFFPGVDLQAAYDLTGYGANADQRAAGAGIGVQQLLFQGGYVRSQLAYQKALAAYGTGLRRHAGSGVKWRVIELYLQAIRSRDDLESARQMLALFAQDSAMPDSSYALRKYARIEGLAGARYKEDYRELMRFIYRPGNSADSLAAPAKFTPDYAGRSAAALENGLLTDNGLLEDRCFLNAATELVRYRQRARMPALALKGYYGPVWQGNAGEAAPVASRNGYLQLRANLPLFNTGTLRRDLLQARLNRQQAELRLLEDERQLGSQLAQYFDQHRQYALLLRQAEEALRASRSAFDAAAAGKTLSAEGLWQADQLYDALLRRNEIRYRLCYQTLWIDFNSGTL